jgi:acetylornithine deacetylase/succinyl-diaminopimelate desuccinylase-like protein
MTGSPPHYGGFWGTTDGSVLRQHGITGVAFGPGSTRDVHKENEKVRLSELFLAAEVYERLMLRSSSVRH